VELPPLVPVALPLELDVRPVVPEEPTDVDELAEEPPEVPVLEAPVLVPPAALLVVDSGCV
jgi:hypothetical protein